MFENRLGNKDNNVDKGTADTQNDFVLTDNEESIKIQETELTNEHATVSNVNEATNENISIGIKIKEENELEITTNENDANPEISSKINEETNYPSDEGNIIRQHQFYIHSTWLAVQSSYFRSLFFCGMKESNAKEVHVQITTNEEQAHLMLLEAMYKIDTLDGTGVNELLNVLKLADKYDVKFVFKKCKYVLQNMVESLEICEQIMHFIKIENTILDVDDLVSTLQSFLAKEFSPLDKTWQRTSFKDLCEPSLKYLLSSDELITASENTVFHALMHWIEEHGIENVLESQELPSLLSVVRFELIPVDYLYNIVQHHSVAKKLPDFNDHYLRGISYHALSEEIRKSLSTQPVKRNGCTFVAYTWVIHRNKLTTLFHLESDEFWYCGYRARLTISQESQSIRSNQSIHTANLSLEILNLTEHSVVEMVWRPCGKHFVSYTDDDKKHTFKKNANISTFEISYEYINKEHVFQGEIKHNSISAIATYPGR